jgi:DNA-binding protein HU-beta
MADLSRSDLIEAIAEQSGLSKVDVERALAATLEVISTALSRGQSVQITGFGTFDTRKRAGRKARNPRTGEEVHVPAARIPVFRAGKALKDMVR